MQDYDNRPNPADVQAASDIAAEHFGTPAVNACPILARGSVNKIVRVEVPPRALVVRMSEEPQAFEQYRKEAWCIRQANTKGVPSPKVLAVGVRNSRSYMIQAFIDGKDGDDCSNDSVGVWRTLGQYAARVHSIPVSGWGLRLIDPASGAFDQSWQKYLAYNVASLTEADPLLALGVLTPKQSPQVRQLFERLEQGRFTFGLSHGDWSPRNARIGIDGRTYLLDWGCARAEIVPHFDLTEILRGHGDTSQEVTAFLDGYGMSREAFEAIRADLKTLSLLRTIDTLRWAIDHAHQSLQRYIDHAKWAIAMNCGNASWPQPQIEDS